jgi:hypothetical protein
MVLGKLLILTFASSTALAGEPFKYDSTLVNRPADLSFGWFKKLDEDQETAYVSSMVHALMYADNGQRVEWYKNGAYGFAVPVYTKSTGGGYCRRIQAYVYAFNQERQFSETACYTNFNDSWRWVVE